MGQLPVGLVRVDGCRLRPTQGQLQTMHPPIRAAFVAYNIAATKD
jgi:hypothetical protein